MSKILLTSDIHLTDQPDDEYRLDFVRDLGGLCRSHGVDTVVILGDITDKKDRHTGVFANKVADAFRKLAEDAVIYILMGNHDYKDPNYPFFDMLNMHKYIKFIREPYKTNLLGHTLFLPHARDPETWGAHIDLDQAFDWAHYIFMHQTVDGSLASNGQRLDGLPIKLFKKTDAQIYSGDIHVPQRIGPVTYVGSPYHVHFGDKFKPRLLLLDDKGGEEEIYYDAPKKLTVAITEPDDLNVLHEAGKFTLGDHIKVRMRLGRQDFGNWLKYKREIIAMCEGFGLKYFGVEMEAKKLKQLPGKKALPQGNVVVDPNQYFDRYCKNEDVGTFTRKVGEEFVGGE